MRRMTAADWLEAGPHLDCPHCGEDGSYRFVGGSDAWSVIACTHCGGEVEASASFVDEHACECGLVCNVRLHVERQIESLDELCPGAVEMASESVLIRRARELRRMARAGVL